MEGLAHMQAAGTYDTINRMFGLESNTDFSNEMIDGILDSRSWVENTGDTDYWKLMEDGSLKYDGDGWLKDENGMYINRDGSKTDEPIKGKTVGSEGIETGLLEILALEKTEENITRVQNMMIVAGMSHTVDTSDPENRAAWMWKGEGTEGNTNVLIGQSLLSGFGMVHLPRTMFSLSEQYVALKFRQLANAQTTSDDVQMGYPSWPKQQEGYEKKTGQTDETWCNLVSYRTDIAMFANESITKLLDKRGIGYTNANLMGENLEKYYPQIKEGWMAQAMANMGLNTKISYINPNLNNSGHIATIVANYGTYIPALGPLVSQGGISNGQMYAGSSYSFGSTLSSSNYYWMLSEDL